jgi:hypothetical protein
MPKQNDLEGSQDEGGKHGGQAGIPVADRSTDGAPARPRDADHKGKVVGDPRPRQTRVGAK